MRQSFLIIFLIFISSCSIAPVNMTTTARSLGENKNQIKLDLPVTGLLYERGLTSKFDMGFGIEEQIAPVFHLFAKYAFINNEESGFSFAEIVGGGYSGSIGRSKSIYFSPIVSYRHNSFEVFTSYRINYVRWDNDLNQDQRDDILSFIPREKSFHYHQMDAGFNFLGDKWTTTVGAKIFIFGKSTSGTPFVDLGYKF